MYRYKLFLIFTLGNLLFGVVKQVICASSYSLHHMKNKFLSDYNSKCSKYPFTRKFYELLEKSIDSNGAKFLTAEGVTYGGGQYNISISIIYMVISGGFGDRLAGLTSAIAYSLMFNRKLYIKSFFPGFEEYFRPYHPNHAYTWNWTETSKDLYRSGYSILDVLIP